MNKILLLLLVTIVPTFAAVAQYSIKGKLADAQTRSRIRGASVALKGATDAAFMRYAITDTAGDFSFTNLTSGRYLLTITYIGYGNYNQSVTVDTAAVNLDTVTLVRAAGLLDSVIVVAKTAIAEQKGDTLQMNASQFKVNPDATVEDLAKKMPGITVENGQVKAMGENVQKVTLDGRDFFGDDATAALRNLPAEIVDKIQVFDRLSDQAQFTGFDDGNTTKSINIVTKASMRNGQYGRIFAGIGSDTRYQAGGNATLLKDSRKISVVGNFNNVNQQNFSSQDLLGVTSASSRGGRGGGGGGGGGGQGSNGSNFQVASQPGINRTTAAGINYTDNWGKKVVFTGSYFFNGTHNTTDESVGRQYFSKDASNSTQLNTGTRDNANHRVNMRFEYKIDSANQLIITPSFSYQKNDASTMGLNKFYDQQTFDTTSSALNRNVSNRSGYNFNNNILYRHAFPKRGRSLSLNLTTGYNDRSGATYTDFLDTTFTDLGYTDSIAKRFTDQTNNGLQLAANVVYTEPLGKSSMLQANYNTSYNKSHADQEAFLYDDAAQKYSDFDALLSSKFNNTNIGQNAGLGYRYSTKSTQLNLGVNYQRTDLHSDQVFPKTLQVDQTFYNLLPNAMLRIKFNAKSTLRVMYRASTTAPSVTQLQDAYDITNTPYITAGNPNLAQQTTQTLNGRYTFTNTEKSVLLVGNIYYQTATDYITNATYLVRRDSVLTPDLTLKKDWQLSKPVNLNGFSSLRSLVTFAVPLKFIKSNLNLNTGLAFAKLPGLLRDTVTSSRNTTFSTGAVISSNISQYVDFNVSYNANFSHVTNNNDPQQNGNYFSQSAGVQFILLSKNGWFLQNDLTNQLTSGYTAAYNQSYFLWNMSAGKKLFSKQQGELKVSAFDILKQNRSIARNVTETYIEDTQNQVLRQYFMLTFTYNLRNFGSAGGRAPGFAPRNQGGRSPGGRNNNF